ncbi:hypothetical protein DNTS_023142 [Danionella cerebrum]|uniref:Proline and serine-rich protein 2 n=1 Tax=Danionella cerebrum TaxID=2873325 RepID=A0A553NIY9_9TELE|nr:hypothetical protein DNTS_023142 [Danionella translucida]
MDVHLHNRHSAPHYGRNPEDYLHYLSPEERESILFFEETIHSIEEDEEPQETRPGLEFKPDPNPLHLESNLDVSHSSEYNPYDNVPIKLEHHLESNTELDRNLDQYQDRLSPLGSSAPHSPVDHDIIDLVHPAPNERRHSNSMPILPDFQYLMPPPETHVEEKPKRESHFDSPHQPPPGSIPTPVVIASKIAEHQGTSSTLSSLITQRRSSLELIPSKQGPPTHAKPMRLPENITMLLGSRENLHQTIANEAFSLQERRAQMLSNLTSLAHPLEGGEPACVRNTPLRSVSFHDPTPDKSRMEALSKLGLAQRRTQSIVRSRDAGLDTKKTALHFNPNPDVQAMDSTDSVRPKSTSSPILTTAEVTQSAFNSFGGKSITLNPTSSFKSDLPQISTHKIEAPEVHLNNFGGRSRVMGPSESNHGVRSQIFTPENSSLNSIPNEESSRWRPSMSKPSQFDAPPPKSEDPSRGRTLHSEQSMDKQSEDPPKWRTSQPETSVSKPFKSETHTNKSTTLIPTPAPRPLHHPPATNPVEIRRKSLPKPAFRSQGITVQFSGRGTTDEQRRDALRKLGLLRDNH